MRCSNSSGQTVDFVRRLFRRLRGLVALVFSSGPGRLPGATLIALPVGPLRAQWVRPRGRFQLITDSPARNLVHTSGPLLCCRPQLKLRDHGVRSLLWGDHIAALTHRPAQSCYFFLQHLGCLHNLSH